jgi:hypothetical protein
LTAVLHDGERAGLEPRAQVLERATEGRRARELAFSQEPADLEVGVWRRLDSAE